MPLSTSFADGAIDQPEDKRFGFFPKDHEGNDITGTLNSITLEVTDPHDSTTTKTKGDFSTSGNERYVYVNFDLTGDYHLALDVEGPNGHRERVEKEVSVQ